MVQGRQGKPTSLISQARIQARQDKQADKRIVHMPREELDREQIDLPKTQTCASVDACSM
jgi:hypothetical protein